jgi:hypothetical protein
MAGGAGGAGTCPGSGARAGGLVTARTAAQFGSRPTGMM